MKKLLAIRLICFLLSGLLFYSCKKQEPEPQTNESLYDLFPLKVGNEFYYKYVHTFYAGPGNGSTRGTETWKVVSEHPQGDYIDYNIERKLNAIHIISIIRVDTTIIKDSIRYFQITEDKSSSA